MHYYSKSRGAAIAEPSAIKKRKNRIHKIILNNGTILFTNSAFPTGFHKE